jgi:hypothetical protein
MDRWTGLARKAMLAGLLLSLLACASEEPAKTLDITNRCDVPVWVRYDDNPGVGTQIFDDKSATPIAAQASYRASVADDENDGVAVAVSATEADVGTIIQVRSVEPERLEVVLDGDRCPT